METLTETELIALRRALSESVIYNEAKLAELAMPHGEHREPQRTELRTFLENQICVVSKISAKIDRFLRTRPTN